MQSFSVRGILPACLISAAAVAALVAPGAASASLGAQCSGAAEIEGQGSTLQAEAVGVWAKGFKTNKETTTSCNGEAGHGTGATVEVKYHESGSGPGYKAWDLSEEYGKYAFIGTDNTANPSEKSSVEAEGTNETGGKLLTIPVAEGAVAMMVHLPSGCLAESKAAKGRLSLSAKSVEEIYAGTKTKWSELTEDGDLLISKTPLKITKVVTTATSKIITDVNGFAGVSVGDLIQAGAGIPHGATVTAELTPKELEISAPATLTEASDTLSFSTSCNAADTIKTIVRAEGSGTTHIFKRWLNWSDELKNLENGATKYTWDELSEGSNSTKWPNGVGVTTAAGSPALVDAVIADESSIGYANLADARNPANAGGFGEPNGGEKKAYFWALVENGETSGVPTYADPSSNKEKATRANANCGSTVYSNGLASFPPPSVESAWNEVTADLHSKTYPICGLTYDFALANYEAFDVSTFPSPFTSLGEAQDVHDYLQFVLNAKGGQKEIAKEHDYLGLPKTVLTKAAEGIPLITWNP